MALFKIHRNETQDSVFPEQNATEGYCYFHDKTGRFVVDLVTATKTGTDKIQADGTERQYINPDAFVGVTRSGTNWVFTTVNGSEFKISQQDKDTNYYHSRAYSSGLKISTGTGVSDMYVPDASGEQKGVTIVYPASQCTTFTSDVGTCTPAAVKKAVETFAVLKAGDTMSGSLTFNNPNATAQKNHPYIIWDAIGENTPCIGYASDQVDGTFLIASLKGTTYQTGLAIGGGSGNLLWKGKRVLTAEDLYVLPTASCTVKGGVKPAYSSTQAATLTTAVASNTTTPTIAAKTTTSGRYYAVESDVNGILFVNVPWTDTNTKVTSVGNHYTPSANADSALSVDASSTTSASWASTSLVTGVNIQRDAAGHVTGITVDSIRMPGNPNTHAVSSVNGQTGAVTLTYSDVGAAASSHGTHVTASTVKSALGTGTGTSKFLREDGTWATPSYYTLTKAKVEAVLTGAITSHTHDYVPTSRTVNGKALSSNISLTASDVGAASSSHGTHVSYGTSASALGTSSAGTASTVSRSDHVHKMPTYSDVGAAASSHGTHVSFSSSAPANLASTASAGSASTVARSDHAHKMPTYSDVGAAASSHGTHVTASTVKSALGTGTGTTKFLREDGSWATPAYYTLTKAKVEAVLTGAITTHTHSYLPLSGGTLTGALTGTTATFTSVKGAVWNDYAEYRSGETTEPGKVVKECPDGILRITESRLEPGCEIISDTFGFAIGETEDCKTPIATSGRVLAYPFENRNTFELGQAVCSGPNGTVSKMTREEIMTYPERIIGTVSEIPNYETWGTGNVQVNGRIWIRIK